MPDSVLVAHMKLVNKKLKFEVRAEGRDSFHVDYVPPKGDGEGYTSLELLLVSLGTCLGSALRVMIPSKLGSEVQSLSIKASGIRKDTMPTSFFSIELELSLRAPGADRGAVEAIIAAAEARVCPVFDMVKGNVKIETRLLLEEVPA